MGKRYSESSNMCDHIIERADYTPEEWAIIAKAFHTSADKDVIVVENYRVITYGVPTEGNLVYYPTHNRYPKDEVGPCIAKEGFIPLPSTEEYLCWTNNFHDLKKYVRLLHKYPSKFNPNMHEYICFVEWENGYSDIHIWGEDIFKEQVLDLVVKEDEDAELQNL